MARRRYSSVFQGFRAKRCRKRLCFGGAQVLDLLVSNLNAGLDKNTALVPIATDYATDKNGERLVQEGIIDKFILQEQTMKAF